MKVLTFVVCVCYLSIVAHGITEEEKQKIKSIRDECQANPSTHLDKETIDKLSKGEHVDTHKLGAHSLCMAKKMHIIKDDGNVDTEIIKKIVSKDTTDEAAITKAVNECSAKKATDEETALQVMKCFHDHVGREMHGHHHEAGH